jgi:hypothetical protein
LDRTSHAAAASLLATVTWQKSHHSNPSGECVELGELPSTGIAIRNSRDPDGPALLCTRAEAGAFIQGAKNGEFDLLVALCQDL